MTTVAALAGSLLLVTPSIQAPSIQGDRQLESALAERIAAARADEFIPVDVVLAEQTDEGLVDAAAAVADKRERRALVIALLRDAAARSQAPLVEFLETERATGGVRGEITRLWIHNVVSAEVTPRVALSLAARSDVALVHYDPPRGREILAAVSPPQGGSGNPTCGLSLMGAPQVWGQLRITGQGIVVGVIDTGLCAAHPDIAGQVWRNPREIENNGVDDDQNGFVDDICGWNFRDGNNDTSDDQYGHGSSVSGFVAGDGTAGTACGVAPDARIMVLRFFNSSAGEQVVWNCMQYGVDNGADVLNGSLGWYHNLGPQRATWRAVCRNTIAAGVVVCYIAGNESCGTQFDNVRTPGDVPDVITVGAVNCSDVPGSFSSCGPVTWQNVAPYNDHPYPPGLVKPDVTAPGASATSHSLCAGYSTGSGTSLASPQVAGLAALILQADPALGHIRVKQILEGSAVDLGPPGKDNRFGSGRVDAFAAVQVALSNGNHCNAKQSSCSTTPWISSDGLPSATATSGFTVVASGMRALQFGMLLYTDAGRNNVPFLGGNLCIQGIHRTPPVVDTAGTLGSCNGVLSIDMNSFRAGLLGGGTPLPALSIPGSTIHCQFFGRDPGNSFNVLLTAGLEYAVCP